MSANKTEKQTAAIGAIPLNVGVEWIKPLAEVPGKVYAEFLNFTAQRLQTQAEYLQGLAKCTSPMELFQQQARFFQDTLADYSNEAVKSLKSA